MPLHELLEKYDIRFKKGLGQNLLLDDNINRIMVDAAAIQADEDVIEVGAGLGMLTRRLQKVARRVLAVEIDASFLACLEEQFADCPNVTLFRGDILNHGLDKLVDEFLPEWESLKMVSNLPYYITTPILFHFWEAPVSVERMVIMVQEEVARRLAAPLGDSEYGKLALAAAYYSEVDIVHRVPRTCFKPMPNVDSCIVRLRNRREPLYPDVDARTLMRVISQAFTKRRKTLRNSLARPGFDGLSSDQVVAALAAADVDTGKRPQELTLDEFARVTAALQRSRAEREP